MKFLATILVIYISGHSLLFAQVPQLILGEKLKIDFQSYSAAGFAPETNDARLDSRFWRLTGLSDGNTEFGGTYLGGDFGRGISQGKVSSGGVYAFQVNPSTRILGFQATGTDLVPGALTLKMKMVDSDSLEAISIKFNAYYLNDQNRSTSVRLEWSVDDKNYTSIEGLAFSTPIANDVEANWQSIVLEASLLANLVLEKKDFYLRWLMNDAGGTGSRDEWGIATIEIVPKPFEKEDHDDGDHDNDGDEDGDEDEEEEDDEDKDNEEEISRPMIPASELRLEHRTDSTLSIRWKNGSGTARLVVIRPDQNTICRPEDSISYYSATHPSMADTTSGSCSVVYNGSGNTAVIEGLKANQLLHFEIFEYNGQQGSERYLLDQTAQASFQTRFIQPKAMQSLNIVHLSDVNLVLNWDISTESEVRIALSNNVPAGNQLLSFDEDAYQTFDSTSLSQVCLENRPCILDRAVLKERSIYAWNVAGPLGHRSAQKEKPMMLKPVWPESDQGITLASWNFDLDTDDNTHTLWDFQDAEFSIIGARDRGYISGSVGRARYADQWDQSNGSKAWKFSLSTWGFSEIRVTFRMISSNTGPADFQIRCSAEGLESSDSSILKAGSAWNTAQLHTVELPKECLGKAWADIYLAAMGTTALNGSSVSRTATSRLDEVTIRGKRLDESSLLLAKPEIIKILDDSTRLVSRWLSAVGDFPLRRYVKIWDGSKNNEVELDATGQKIQSLTVKNGKPNTDHSIALCAWTITKQSCSESIIYRTPIAIPEAPDRISVTPTHFDTLSIHHPHTGSDTWVYLSKSHLPEPQFVDSVGLKSTLPKSESVHRRFPSGQRIVFGALQPGSVYHLWLASVAGPDSIMRFSRPPHRYQRIEMPKLPAPDAPRLEVNIVQRGTDLIRLEVDSDPKINILWTLADARIPESLPIDDQAYRADSRYGQGDLLSKDVYVIGKGNLKEILIHQLPLSRSWVLRAYAYQELNGAISYTRIPVLEYPIDSLKDPRDLVIRVPDLTQKKPEQGFGLLGVVDWVDSNRIILRGEGGNVLLHTRNTDLNPGDSIAAFVQPDAAVYTLDYYLSLGLAKLNTPEPNVVDPRNEFSDLRSQTYLGFGNMLSTGERCADTGRLFLQRGQMRRPVCVLNGDDIPSSVLSVTEVAIRGIPLWSENEILQIWIKSMMDIIPYQPGKVMQALPNTAQVLTWKEGSSENIRFSWVRRPSQRPYDVWPDSSQWRTYFGTRIAGVGNPFVLRAQVDELEMGVPAGEVYRLHLGEDTLTTHIDIEWTVWNQEGRSSDAREEELLWQPFQLLKLLSTGLTDSDTMPKNFDLGLPWPNPFNPSTNFRVEIPSLGLVRVEIYDILGRKVATIADKDYPSGVHEFSWDASDFASGIYILHVQYKDQRLVRTMSLLK
jgi:hypothetical protein